VKKIYFSWLVLVLGSPAYAQKNLSIETKPQEMYFYQCENNQVTSNVRLNEIGANVYRRFLRNFPFLKAELWIRTPLGFTVKATDERGVRYNLALDQKGILLWQLKYYEASAVPDSVRSLVRRYFNGGTLMSATEFNSGTSHVVGIDLYRDGMQKIIKISGDNMEVIAEFQEQNIAGNLPNEKSLQK